MRPCGVRFGAPSIVAVMPLAGDTVSFGCARVRFPALPTRTVTVAEWPPFATRGVEAVTLSVGVAARADAEVAPNAVTARAERRATEPSRRAAVNGYGMSDLRGRSQ